jgi:hypothetical protein
MQFMNIKWFNDRRNCLKSKLKSAEGKKLTKIVNEEEVNILKGQLKELDYIQYKFKIHL